MLQQLTKGVFVHQSPLLQNNSVVVLGKTGALVVDPGITGTEMACLAADIRKLGQPVTAGFATHPDWDHVLWHSDLGSAPRYGTAQCTTQMQELLAKPDWKKQATEMLPPEISAEVPLEGFGALTALPAEAAGIPWDGPTVRILEHAAHAQGHAALWVEEQKVLIAGDMLSDLFVPMLNLGEATDPLGDYLTALALFEGVVDEHTIVIPGHGSPAKGSEVRERIERDRAYVLALQNGTTPDDPRILTPQKGYEWTVSIHEWQAQQVQSQKRQ